MSTQGRSGSSGGQKSTGTAVKEQGSQTAQHVGQTGRQVAQKATQEGKQVAAEAGRQAHGVMDQAQAQLMEQAGAQQQRAAEGLRSLGDQLRSAADNGQQGAANDLIRQASGRISQVADWLEHREPGQLVEEVREFARRRPGAFLGSAALAGMLVGRFTRGMTSGGGDASMGMSPDGGRPDGSNPSPPSAQATPSDLQPPAGAPSEGMHP